ncbi:hypothetical protein GGI21_002223 [Coemansia aciculifera]|nr:hypothetical protein GGI21_002223 [Coemansia aciculifera]
MEHNNFYVFHQGDGVLTPKHKYLFVYPSSESLTDDVIMDFATSVFRKKKKGKYAELPEYWHCSVRNSVLDQLELESEKQNTDRRALLVSHANRFYRYLYLGSPVRADNQEMPHGDLLLMKNSMDKLVEIYKTAIVDTPASKMDTVLASKDIYVYDAHKLGEPYVFDKRSDEGKAFIQAKAAAKQEKEATRRSHNANDKRRILEIDASKLSVPQ